MIDPKELRIGNYICDDEGCLSKVIGFNPHEHLVRCDSNEGCQILVDCYYASGSIVSGCVTESDQCTAIPLSSDWLLKLGFCKSETNDVNENELWSIQVANNTCLYYEPNSGNNDWYLSCEWNNNHYKNDFWGAPKYVHQLQNLYYALTNEELSIK